jgi:hypothetical protein
MGEEKKGAVQVESERERISAHGGNRRRKRIGDRRRRQNDVKRRRGLTERRWRK